MAHGRSDADVVRTTRNTARFFTETRHVSWVMLIFTLLWGVPYLVTAQGLSVSTASGLLTLLVACTIVIGPVLGVLTIAAIASDGFWTSRFEASDSERATSSSPAPDRSRRA